MAEYSVYELLDSLDSTVRYVGIAYDPKRRLKDHLLGNDESNPRKSQWVREIVE